MVCPINARGQFRGRYKELSRDLVKLDENTPLDFTLEDLEVRDPDADQLLGFLAEMEFRTLSKRVAEVLGKEAPTIAEAPVAADAPGAADVPFDAELYEHVSDTAALQAWIDRIYEFGYVAVDTETTGLDDMVAQLVGVSLCVEPGKACYIPLIHKARGSDDLFGSDDLAEGQIPTEEALRLLTPMLEDPSILKIGQNMKYDSKIFAQLGINVAPIDDTMLLSYAMHAGLHGHGMDTLSERYLSHTPIPIKPLLGTGKSAITFDKVPLVDAVKYAAEDADITLRLWQLFKPQLHRVGVTKVYETLERPLVPVLAAMERSGVKVDRDTLSRMSNAFAQKMAGLEDEIYELAGRKFNVGSPKQLGEILFDEMGLPGGKKTKTGAYGTGADVLETLAAEGHELSAQVLDWRQLAKLKSTYTDSLVEDINPATGRVHTNYGQAIASTGRLSSNNPNLQNIPVRTQAGRQIREGFVVASDHECLMTADYSQIEMRIMAHLSGDEGLIEAFNTGEDLHSFVASRAFSVPLDEVTAELRRRVKAMSYGLAYGLSAYGLAQQLKISSEEAKVQMEQYFDRFGGVRDYLRDVVDQARKDGYTSTVFGRRRYLPELDSSNRNVREAAERAALNAPIQGSAADIIKVAMINVDKAVRDAGLASRMLLQVHDELVVEVVRGERETVERVLREEMGGAAELLAYGTAVTLEAE